VELDPSRNKNKVRKKRSGVRGRQKKVNSLALRRRQGAPEFGKKTKRRQSQKEKGDKGLLTTVHPKRLYPNENLACGKGESR